MTLANISFAEEAPKKEEWLKFGAEGRYRFELRDNFGFAPSHNAFSLTRFRLSADITPMENVRFFFQGQDSRIYGSNFKGKAALTPFVDRFDLRQGYADLKKLFDLPLEVIVGRQELVFGEERLVGAFNWGNVAQSFDALRLASETKDYRVDLFSSEKVLTSPDSFGERDHKDHFHGIYATWKKIPKHVWDLYTFIRDTDNKRSFSRPLPPHRMTEVTFGTRIKGSDIHGWDYSLETAGQAGSYGPGNIQAFMLISQVGYTFDKIFWTPRLSFEYDHASGQDNPKSKNRHTFDNLYPTNHYFYGYADQVSLQNINDFKFALDVKPVKKLSFSTSIHLFYLDSSDDALYNAARQVSRFDPTGNASTHVGEEWDLLAKYQVNEHWWLETGYSHFFTGGFIADTGRSKDLDFYYALVSFKY